MTHRAGDSAVSAERCHHRPGFSRLIFNNLYCALQRPANIGGRLECEPVAHPEAELKKSESPTRRPWAAPPLTICEYPGNNLGMANSEERGCPFHRRSSGFRLPAS